VTNSDLLTQDFPVPLPDGTVLTCRKLDLIGERRILDELGRALLASYGKGSYMANAKPVLDWMADNKMHADRPQVVAEIARMVAVKAAPPDHAIWDYRATPAGLARELFLRTRETHPDLAEEVILTQLNAVTAWRVAAELERGLSEDSKRRPADSDAPDPG